MPHSDSSFEVTDYGGKRALVVKRWSSECDRLLQDEHLLVVLNQARGWAPEPLTFLAGRQIRSLAILAHTPLVGLESVLEIRGLERLSLDCEPTSEINLGRLQSLQHCWLSWSPHYQSIFTLHSLVSIGFSSYPHRDLSPLGQMRGLERISIKEGKLKTLFGLRALSSTLTYLELAGLPHLGSLDEIDHLDRLRCLRVDGCRKITSLQPLTSLTNLRTLTLSDLGDLDSLSPVQGLDQLEQLVFAESTNILDGDLSHISKLPSLREVIFQPRRHYTHFSLFGLTRPIRKPWRRPSVQV